MITQQGRQSDGTFGSDEEDGLAVLGVTIGVRELSRNVSGIVNDVVATGRPAIVTKHGKPVAAIVPIN